MPDPRYTSGPAFTFNVADAVARLGLVPRTGPEPTFRDIPDAELVVTADILGRYEVWHCERCQWTGPEREHPARCHGVPVAATVLIVRGWTGG